MSDIAVKQRLKVSREGVVLIKSLEGFRSRATPGPSGGWVIGYGHTLSAREGAVVGEGDAELLLQYDLLPVVAAINDHVTAPLNQHQIDALASFAFSVGVDRFIASDVVERLNADVFKDAADALIRWSVDHEEPSSALRRRAAERALFMADPAAPVALADLLTAPMPEPEPIPEPAAVADVPVATEALATPLQPEREEARALAVATLLGENDTPGVEASPVPDVEPAVEAQPEVVASDPSATESAAQPTATDTPPTPAMDATQASERTSGGLVINALPPAPAAQTQARLNYLRYSPYGAPIVGPLPGLPTLSLRASFPAPSATPGEPVKTDVPPLAAPVSLPAEIPPASQAVDSGTLLVLTPLEDDDVVPAPRPVWPEHQRAGPATEADPPLFGEDINLAQGYGSVLRHETLEVETPQGFEWGENSLFAIMGGVGLASFSAALAAFWKASEAGEPLGEIAMIGWLLALIGLTCVGISAYNLYRRLGRRRPDRNSG